MLKKFPTYQIISELDAAILRYMQPSNMTPRQYSNALVPEPCKFASVYDGETLNGIFNKDVNGFIAHSNLHYWAQVPQAELNNKSLQRESPLFVMLGARYTAHNN